MISISYDIIKSFKGIVASMKEFGEKKEMVKISCVGSDDKCENRFVRSFSRKSDLFARHRLGSLFFLCNSSFIKVRNDQKNLFYLLLLLFYNQIRHSTIL